MIQLDNTFLEEAGLGDLPKDEKQALLVWLYENLGQVVGERLTDGMSDEQMTEFEEISTGDEAKINAWLQENVADYAERDDFKQLLQTTEASPDEKAPREVLTGYASTKWLEMHRPDYQEVVQNVLEEMKQYLQGYKSEIIDPLQDTGVNRD